MVGQIKFCVAGVRSPEVVAAAAAAGADAIAVEVSAHSSRRVDAEDRANLWAGWPDGVKKIAVVRNPGFGDLDAVAGDEFDQVLVHFPNETPFFEVAMWTDIIVPERLLLAPHVLPGGSLDLAFLPLADHIVLERYRPNSMQLDAKTGDWAEFARLQAMHAKCEWILAGGLQPENLSEAIASAQARSVLIGGTSIEQAPGEIDLSKLLGFMSTAAALQAA